MKPLFPLDDQPGPAKPLDDARAQLMVARALEAAGPRAASAGRHRRGRGWAVAAVLVFGLSGTTWAAWRSGLLPTFDGRGPGPSPVMEPKVAPDVGLDFEASPAGEVEAPPEEGSAKPNGPGTTGSAGTGRAAPGTTGSAGPDTAPAPTGPERTPGSMAAASARPGAPSEREPPRSARRAASRAAPVDLLAEANRRRRLGEWKRAASVYIQAARRASSPAIRQTAWVAVGDLRLESMNRPGDAVFAFRAALDVEGPLEAEALWGLGLALWRSGRPEEARRVWTRLVQTHPERAEARRARARLEP
ncbi:MAG TPA: tetratricopeptide repeat protein [Myxococcales bacterium LLY-WYZ-16_1]|nr:tetratricopeptide repeat protein [Myxococcales bacterium LLY-WYZ-16_1]